MRNSISPNRILLLFACLLLLVTPLHAQDDDSDVQADFAKDKAWLALYIDPHGAATVFLELGAEVRERTQLEHALAQSFSFPLEFREPMVRKGEQPLTIISARSPKAFTGGTLRSTCEIDVQPLLPQLAQHHMNSMKVMVFFQNGNRDVRIAGAQRLEVGTASYDHYEADVDVHAGTFPVIEFAMGYTAADLSKRLLPLLLFLVAPALWTSLSVRRRSASPEELWGRHLRFLHRLLNVVWIAWLPIYFISGLDEIIRFLFGADRRGVGQVVNVAFYFIPPVIAMVLCHFASRRVYEQVLSVDWSPRRVVRHAIIANSLSLIPMFLVIVGMYTFFRSPRLAAVYIIIGYMGFMVLSQTMARLLGSRLHALTSGDLRNRIFDLAHRAGVKLRQVYVLPATSAQLSNAFARSDNSVMITNSLLKNLSRREVDGILAHEIGHLQAKHPQSALAIMVMTIVIMNVVGGMIVKFVNLVNATPLIFTVAVGAANLIVFFRSRRNERMADAIGVGLTGDPEAFISGLAKLSRLNLTPLHSGGWGRSLDTHPETMRRFEEIAKAHGISEIRVHELVTDDAPAQDKYAPLDEEVETTIFSTEFKNKYRLRVALVVLGYMLLAPVPFAVALAREDVSLFGMLGLGIAGVVWSFGSSFVLRNRIAFWGYRDLCRRLKLKLDKRGLGDAARHAALVGLAPAAESRKYEGYAFWDLGVLWLTKEKLYYIGEKCEFALEREQVNEVYSRDYAPEWLPEKSLFIRWKEYSAGPAKTLHFVATGENSVLKSRRAIDSLQQRVQAWMYQSVSFLPSPATLKGMSTPVFPEITTQPALLKFNFAFTFKAALRLSIHAAVIAFAIRLSYISIAYMAVAAFLLTFVDELSRALKEKQQDTPVIPKPPSFEAGTYQAGSWKNA